jgi:hypothetical protein
MESLAERCPTNRALLHSSIKVPSTREPPTYQVPLEWKVAPWRRMPISRDFLNISSRVPSEGAPPEAPFMEPLQRETERERDASSTETPSSISRSSQ